MLKFSEYLNSTGRYEIYLICAEQEDIYEKIPEFLHYIPVSMKRGITLSAFSAVMSMRKVFKREKFDLVQYSTPNAAFYASIAAKSQGVPVRLYCQWGIRYMGFEGWKRNLFKFIEKITCYNSTFIEPESLNIRTFYIDEKLYKSEKSAVIWNGSACGVDFGKFDISKRQTWRKEIREKYSIPKECTVFCFAARLTADKGINELLEAYGEIRKNQQSVRLLIMGSVDNQGSLKPELWEMAQNTSDIILTGEVPDVEKYYAASDIFISPSYREGFGLVVIEAETMGLPAIVSDVPGQVDAIIPDVTGMLVTVKDSKTLQQAMEVYLSDPKRIDEMGQRAYEFVRDHFEQNVLFERLMESRERLYKEIENAKN